MAKRKIKSAFKLEGVLDSLGKSWNCNCEVEQGSICISPLGYNKHYPFILSKDDKFVKNLKDRLYDIGIYKLEVETDEIGDIVQFYLQ